MKVAVLLTCHNRRTKTIECLQHLHNQIGVNNWTFDTYLVDDASTDGTKDAVKERFPDTIVIDGTGELFWNKHTADCELELYFSSVGKVKFEFKGTSDIKEICKTISEYVLR